VVLEPTGLALSPQLVKPPELTALVDLIETTGSEDTTPAPWWSDIEVQPDPPPDNVTYLDGRSTTWGTAHTEGALIMEAAMDPVSSPVHHPILQLLGPIELLGAAGTMPPRAAKQCLEYCAWLLENPGRTSQAMVAALAVAEGTRRSNMSRLRTWLGTSPDGEAYLPDAYTGRITLHPAVSSDWQRLQILTASGVIRASDKSLEAALEVVRGAPLADAAPGQWHWAEELRTDMISCIRDIGLELADRALLAGDLERARWAASRALLAAPGDELLLAARIRTEHAAGNRAETERLTLQLAAQARTLGVDLDDETVSLLQQGHGRTGTSAGWRKVPRVRSGNLAPPCRSSHHQASPPASSWTGCRCLSAAGGLRPLSAIRRLLDSGAVVTVVAPEIGATVADLAARGLLIIRRRPPAPDDFTGAALVGASDRCC
jgi:hypothetical protein